MTRFLAIVRRILWGGTISLLLCIFLFDVSFSSIMGVAHNYTSANGVFAIFFIASPIMYLIFTLISVVCIRRNGQFAAFHQTQSPVTTFFRCWGSDIAAPFKNIGKFFMALFSKNVIGRGILIGRFIEMIILILVCLAGIDILA